MKARRSLISRIASVLRKPKPKAEPEPETKPVVKARKPIKAPKHRGIEFLEGRIAPATLIDVVTEGVVHVHDLDGCAVVPREGCAAEDVRVVDRKRAGDERENPGTVGCDEGKPVDRAKSVPSAGRTACRCG